MELMEARNKLDAKDKVGYIYISTGHMSSVHSPGENICLLFSFK